MMIKSVANPLSIFYKQYLAALKNVHFYSSLLVGHATYEKVIFNSKRRFATSLKHKSFQKKHLTSSERGLKYKLYCGDPNSVLPLEISKISSTDLKVKPDFKPFLSHSTNSETIPKALPNAENLI